MSKPAIPDDVRSVAAAAASDARVELSEINPDAAKLWGASGIVEAMNDQFARAIISAEKRGEEREREAIARVVEAIEKGVAAIPVRSDIVRSASATMIDVLRTIAAETRKRGA